jgi:tetratricopeptide (TPR) repeat protein
MPAWLGKLFAPRRKSSQEQVSENNTETTPEARSSALVSQGDSQLAAGDLAGAEQHYRQAVSTHPENAKARFKLGYTLQESGRTGEAEQALRQAANCDPAIADIWFLLGEGARAKDATQSIATLRRCLHIDPAFEVAYSSLIGVLLNQQRFDEAASALSTAVQHFPHSLEFNFLLGNIHFEQEHFAEAVLHFKAAIAIQPENDNSYGNLAQALEKLDQLDHARKAIQYACILNPGAAEWQMNDGVIAQKDNRLDYAIESLQRALALRPDYADAHANLGSVYQKKRQFDLAEASYREALRCNRTAAELHFNLGSVLFDRLQLQAAVDAYQSALQLNPAHDRAQLNLASTLIALRQFPAALTHIEAVVTLQAEHADAHWNKAVLLLLLGDFLNGWREYEYRWKTTTQQESAQYTQPQWMGSEDIRGKTILIFAEQGLGDTIQFVRFVTEVKAKGATVLLQVQPPLQKLLSNFNGVDHLFSQHDKLDGVPFDFQCPLMSLPFALRTQLETIPTQVPYIDAPADRVQHWREQFPSSSKPRVGLVWAGNPNHKNDHNRSMSLQTLAPLLGITDLNFLSLQKEVPKPDRDLFDTIDTLQDLSPHLTDFAETAAIIANLDLVIAVDTSVAHMVGALGVPAWIMLPDNPDYRWLLDRADCPWYPSARLYRQARAGDWSDVIDAIGADLRTLAERRLQSGQ